VGTAKRERKKEFRRARVEAAQAAQRRKRRFRLALNFVLFAVVLLAVLIWVSRRGDDEADTAGTATTTTASAVECPELDGSSEPRLDFPGPPPTCIDPANTYNAVFETSEGTVRFALDTETTPNTTNNFVVLALYHYYDNTQLFRTNTGIAIIQGGSPHTQDNSDPGPGYTIPDEPADGFSEDGSTGPFTYAAGDLVMARSAGPDSSGAQFFFGVNDAVSALDAQGTYIKFGAVTDGLPVLESILALHQPTDPADPTEGAPSRPVTVTQVIIETAPGG
jgi:cyclophilin family peptidyl-prolyl cis-trans isomerase